MVRGGGAVTAGRKLARVRHWSRAVVCVALLVSGALAGVSATAAGTDTKPTPFEAMAGDLLAGLAKQESVKDRLLAKWNGNWRVAVWPFDRGEPIPVPKALARSWNDQLLDALVKRNVQKFRFVSRTDLDVLIKEVEGMDLTGQIKNPVAAVAGKAKVDVLIVGHVVNEDGGVKLSYRALDMGGGILASTTKHAIPIDVATIGAADDSLTLDAAIERAANDFVGSVENLRRVRRQGLRYADSGVQTSFGRYVSERLTDAVQNAGSGGLRDQGIQVSDAMIDMHAVRAKRGLDVKSRDVDAMLAGGADGDYLLSGTYWDLGRFVQLRFVLRNAKGDGRTFNRRVHKASIPPGLDLAPSEGAVTAAAGGNLGYGPIGLELTSNKGFDPVFRVGEEMVLLLRASQDAFLTCFYHQADRTTIKAFPNKFEPNARIAGRGQVQVPAEGSPLQFKISPPSGVERLRCFATDRDPAPYLPASVAQNDLKPVPHDLVDRLSEIFRVIPGAKVTEAVMTVTVEE